MTFVVVSAFGSPSVSNASFLPSNAIGPSFVRQSPPDFTTTRLHSSVPHSRKKKKKKNGTQAKSSKEKESPTRKGGPGRPLQVDELTEHVAQRYNWGETGPMGSKVQSRGVVGEGEDSQAKYIQELNKRPSLVLNADYQPLSYLPLSLWSWQDAVKAIFSGKVTVVDVYPDISIRAANLEVPLPSVIALTDYVKKVNQRPAFTRRNVFLRDEYKCQYCNDRFHTADLSLDHVKPRCMGGQLNWENAVTSCTKCNGRKGSLPVSELRSVGMRLIREPRCPTQMELAARSARMVPKRVHPTWKPYLGIIEASSKQYAKGGDEQFIDDRYFEEEN